MSQQKLLHAFKNLKINSRTLDREHAHDLELDGRYVVQISPDTATSTNLFQGDNHVSFEIKNSFDLIENALLEVVLTESGASTASITDPFMWFRRIEFKSN